MSDTPIYDEMAVTYLPRTWQHSRKGRVHGVIKRQDETWTWVELYGSQELRYYSEFYSDVFEGGHSDGDVIQLRTAFMKEIDITEKGGDEQ